jgi:hypothetical protein
MGRPTRRTSSTHRARPVERRRDPIASRSLEYVARQFAGFRRSNPTQTKIPDPLRAAAVAAMRQGVTRSELRRTCGISSGQLDQWQRSRGATAEPTTGAPPPARVFSVDDDELERNPETVGATGEQQLELRLGGWSISVRQVGP